MPRKRTRKNLRHRIRARREVALMNLERHPVLKAPKSKDKEVEKPRKKRLERVEAEIATLRAHIGMG